MTDHLPDPRSIAPSAQGGPLSNHDLEAMADQAREERRLGLLILENKTGAALDAGVPHFRRCAELWEKAGSPARRAEVLVDLGKLFSKAGNHADGVKVLVEALKALEFANEQRLALDAATRAGQACLMLRGGDDNGVRLLKRALQIAQDLNDHVQIGMCQLDLAQGLIQRKGNGDAAEAIQHSDRALKVFVSFRKGPLRAQTHECKAAAYALLGDFAASASEYEASVTLSSELARSYDATETIARWAEMERRHGNFEQAIALHQRCIATHKQTDNKALLAQSLRRLGLVHVKCEAYAEAIACYLQSLDLCEVVKDHDGLSRSLYLLGAAEANAQHADLAFTYLNRSLAAATASNNLQHQEQALSAIASLHRQLGDNDNALTVMQQWVQLLAKLGERSDQIRVLGSIAELHQEMGALAEAEAHLQRLVRVCTHPEDQPQRSRALHGLGTTLARRGAHPEAFAYFREALPGFSDQPIVRARILHQMGISALHLVESHTALEYLQESLAIYTELKDDKARARLLVDVGNAQVALGNKVDAKELFEEAADMCEGQGDLRATTIIRKASKGL
jgi:tetratricopeptide (TPR) repeat protein